MIQKYLENITKEFNTGRAREHSYRPAIKELLESINPNILATNEPARVSCGAPDFIVTCNKNIPRGYLEAKDILPNILDDKKNQDQIHKYFDWELGYNFIHTDYIEFRFYRNAELVESVKIADLLNNKIVPISWEFEKLEMLLKNFLTFKTQTITSSKKLAVIMAGKARMIKRAIYLWLLNNKERKTEIHNQFEIFKKTLVHDLDEEGFADIYAQTITYGLFTARLHDPTLETFDRDEAARLLPKSNPFLKRFFQSLRDDLDKWIEWIVDDLIEIFLACDVKKLLDWYGKTTARNDPIIHFYEDFLWSYDAKLRKAKWVYYTPEPVVNFMIRGVDYILKNEFNLSDWIADTSKIEIEVDSQEVNKRTGKLKKTKKEVHKVQILDPATGTGTFLNDIVKYVYESRFKGMTGIWKSYVDENLLPRLHGFEIMMASYAMAHLKLDLTLQSTGYKNEDQQRLGIYLTNSLEEDHEDTGTLFANWLSQEAQEASHIKKNMPIMTIIGNPPYSGSSMNNSDWIQNLIEDYKKEPGGKEKLKERKHWLNDDYVKFIKYWEQYIEKNWEWILAYISNNWYLDNPTFRWMRWKLLQTFDAIYIYDLHGNSKKKEISLDGKADQNVFDIMVWVNIIFWIKNGKKKKWELADIYSFDHLWKRQDKYEKLWNSDFNTVQWKKINPVAPHYFFVEKDFEWEEKYNKWFSLNSIFNENVTWIVTMWDNYIIWENKEIINNRVSEFINNNISKENFDKKYSLWKNYSKWIYESLENWKINNFDTNKLEKISYRPFDNRYTYFDKNFIWRTRWKVTSHFVWRDNLWLLVTKAFRDKDFNHSFVTNTISEVIFLSPKTASNAINIPLYIYNEQKEHLLDENIPEKVPNFNMEIIGKIEKKLKMKLEKDFSPEDLFDYIYAVLHSKSYRETYKEFLKIDFPKVPFDVDKKVFFELVQLWRELRSFHLMENENLIPKNFITNYPIDGNNEVGKIKYADEKVFINDEQYFDGVPQNVWEFHIGGYQPAQKWLKDRKGRELNYEDILHYSKIILCLKETVRIMEDIENIYVI